LTFYQSTPDDVKTVNGDFRGCHTDNPDSPAPLADVTRCTVIQTTGSSPDASLRQEFLFKRGVLQAVRVTASDGPTFEALSADVANDMRTPSPQ
jgi:hypothetical protein